ncbi:MAG: calcium-binding protein [Synechococcaceae cyanobacterium]|nr:calcium-binding protein [Synechococcaceae cyanobacterium]
MSVLEGLQNEVTLRQDGRRLSLEGVLTGAALGILLLYLLDEAMAALSPPRGAGPVEGFETSDPGPFRTAVGRIQVAPLEQLELGAVGGRPRLGGGSAPELPPSGVSVTAPPARPPLAAVARAPQSVLGAVGVSPFAVLPSGAGGRASPSPAPPPTPTPPSPPSPPDPDPPTPPLSRQLPQMVLVLVRTDDQSTSRALDSRADSSQTLRQHGIESSTIDLQQARGASLEVLSDRRVQGSALSLQDDAALELIASHAAVVGSRLLGGRGGEVVLLSARDLIQLGLLSEAQTRTVVSSETVAMRDSSLLDPQGHNLLALQASGELSFIGLGDSRNLTLAFDLLTQGLRDSAISLGDGDNVVTVNSGFHGDLGRLAAAAGTDSVGSDPGTGLRIALEDPSALLEAEAGWSFSLQARAIGLQDSSLRTGSGNDAISISTRLDADLAADLGLLYGNSDTHITLERIGLLRSTLDTGAGNDRVRIDGLVIDSTIDLGAGDNTLFLEGPLRGSSRILSGPGRNTIVLSSDLGGEVHGGDGDDRFDLTALPLAGVIDGGAGDDSLASGGAGQRELALIQGPDRGLLGGVRFNAVEGLDLGAGDDVALMSLEGSLTGMLLGGSGLDRLEFSNWELPVSVDLDLGRATAVGSGADGRLQGFEQVIGGRGNDVLASSGRFAGLDGNEGDDVLFLRWSPWLSPDRDGLELRGGQGRDTVVIAGLDGAIPDGWDGVSGIPTLSDLHLDLTSASGDGDRLGWLRQSTDSEGKATGSVFLSLTPSGLEGIGDARLLPIAPLEQLISGIGDSGPQLAIAWDPAAGSTSSVELHLLGSEGAGSSRLIAYLPGDSLQRERQIPSASA